MTTQQIEIERRAYETARYVARMVQGIQGLESAGVDPPGYQRLVEIAAQALLAGDHQKLWDED